MELVVLNGVFTLDASSIKGVACSRPVWIRIGLTYVGVKGCDIGIGGGNQRRHLVLCNHRVRSILYTLTYSGV